MYAFSVWYPRLLLFTRIRVHCSHTRALQCARMRFLALVPRCRARTKNPNSPRADEPTSLPVEYTEPCRLGEVLLYRSLRLYTHAQLRAKLSAAPKCAARQVVGKCIARQVVGCAKVRSFALPTIFAIFYWIRCPPRGSDRNGALH
jgi:hypothetical protein